VSASSAYKLASLLNFPAIGADGNFRFCYYECACNDALIANQHSLGLRTSVKDVGAIALAVVAVIFVTLTGSTAAFAAQLTIQCVNVASGASWNLQVDDREQTVDGISARITAAGISWRDALSGGAFDLDRSSGILTFTNASSTGGYILRHQCRLN
jgi:hypothetical protein